MSYGTDLDDMTHRAASYVDTRSSRAQPADLPVEQSFKYELVITSRPRRRSR